MPASTDTEWMRLTAEELRARAAADALVIVPVASLEQHGPHLATGTDIVLAGAVASRVAARIAASGAPVVTTPVVWTGLADHHLEFGGTVSLRFEEFAGVLRGILRSAAKCGFRRAMLLNGHGGNAEAVAVVAVQASGESGLKVAAGTYWHIVPEVIAPLLERQAGLMHACEAETSMMLALVPGWATRPDRMAEAHGPGSTRVAGQPPGLHMRHGFKALSPSGVIGDARVADPEKGERLLEAIAEAISGHLLNPALWA